MRRIVRVRIFHQTDPAGLIPGGIDSFIKGIVKWSPDDIEISIVGLTTDNKERPTGKWVNVNVGHKSISFLPVGVYQNPSGRTRIPLSVRLTAGIMRYWSQSSAQCDILEFHRIEPAIPFYFNRLPKHLFMHSDTAAICNKRSSIGWKHAPKAFLMLESAIIPTMGKVFCVKTETVNDYKKRYPNFADRFSFISTWMDPDTFFPVSHERKHEIRAAFGAEFGIKGDDVLFVSVGRLDQEKNPLLLIETFIEVVKKCPRAKLIVVGDGVLRSTMERILENEKLKGKVIMAGLRNSEQIAKILQMSEVYVMTSAYEGMPISVLEALACGIPVVSTAVGELYRVIHSREVGVLVNQHDPEVLAEAVLQVLRKKTAESSLECVKAASTFVPDKVLKPVFETYRRHAINTKQ